MLDFFPPSRFWASLLPAPARAWAVDGLLREPVLEARLPLLDILGEGLPDLLASGAIDREPELGFVGAFTFAIFPSSTYLTFFGTSMLATFRELPLFP